MPDQSSKTTPLDATVFDGAPPLGALAMIGPAIIVAGLMLMLVGASVGSAVVAFGTACAIFYGLRPRRREKHTRVFCNVGNVRIEGGARIHARDVVGATTARFDEHVTLAIAHRRRRSPVIIDVANDAAVIRICRSLGVGHHGFGVIEAVARPPQIDALRYLTHLATLVFMIAGAISREPTLVLLGYSSAILTAFVAMMTSASARAMIRMTSQGVFLPTVAGKAFAPFNLISHIELKGDELVVEMQTGDKAPITWHSPVSTSRWRTQGMTRAELEHIVAQVRAATDRAHGKFILKNESESAVEKLRRTDGESLRAWLARIDTLSTGSAGYRAMSIEEPELWSLLEDPEAAADTRTAAARVLARVAPDELRVRIANVLATERNKNVRARIRASLDEDALEDEERAEDRAQRSS